MQTRKWQDQSGQDRYSTEVVLQGFNSTLTMIGGRGDSAGGGASRGGDFGGSGGGYDDYGSAPSAPRGGGSAGRGSSAPSGGFSRDLDDDIPF